jgi:hypothetical protein
MKTAIGVYRGYASHQFVLHLTEVFRHLMLQIINQPNPAIHSNYSVISKAFKVKICSV